MKKKLILKKEVIVSLENNQMNEIRGGAFTDKKSFCNDCKPTSEVNKTLCGCPDTNPGMSGLCMVSRTYVPNIVDPDTVIQMPEC